MDDLSMVGETRRFVQLASSSLGFDPVQQGRLTIVVNELGNNLVKYARGGLLIFRFSKYHDYYEAEIIALDRGPGFSDSLAVMRDGFTTGSTPGTGLGAVKRQSDVFDIHSRPGAGTVVVSIIRSQEAITPKSHYRFSAISIPYPGENVCGDGWAIKEDTDGISILMSDGLGHGVNANKASEQAVSAFLQTQLRSIEQLIPLIHGRLKSTRGAAIFLVRIEAGRVQFAGVGNIRAILQNLLKSRTLISHNGTAGLQMRTTKMLTSTWEKGDKLIMHSDGVTSRWDFNQYPELLSHHPAIIAAVIYREFERTKDDVSILVMEAMDAS